MKFFFECKDCTKRHLGCHDECEAYKRDKEEYGRLKVIEENERDIRKYVRATADKNLTKAARRKGWRKVLR